MTSRLLRCALLVAALASALVGCKIVHDEDKARLNPSDPANFDARAYVNGLWDARAMPLFRTQAQEVGVVLDALAADKEAAGKRFGHRANDGSPWTFAVRGDGVVKSASTASRRGEIVVETGAPGTGRDVALQIGPVVFGTALRDALPFIAFGDFVNQIQYAEVSRALNDRAVAQVRERLDPAALVGKRVAFAGAMTDPGAVGGTAVVPVILQPAAG